MRLRRGQTCPVRLHGTRPLAKREVKKHVISIANSDKVTAVNLETLKLYCDVVRLRSFSRGAAAKSARAFSKPCSRARQAS